MSVDIRVGNKFLLGKRINGGSFGDIYLGSNVTTGEEVAIKLESRRSSCLQLLREAKVYNSMENEVGFPRIRWYGTAGDYNAIVIDLLGKSLEDLFEKCKRRFTMKSVLSLADQMICRLESMHVKGFVHRDVKPDNFLMGRGSRSSTCHILDFGLSKLYCHPSSLKHIPMKEGKRLTGTVRYASLNAHEGRELSRRDDLESLGYCLVYFLNGRLPWQGLKTSSQKKKYELILDMKRKIVPEKLCKGLPDEFCLYFRYTRNLKFEECPNYVYLRQLFRDLLHRSGLRNDGFYDWDIEEHRRLRLHRFPRNRLDGNVKQKRSHSNVSSKKNTDIKKSIKFPMIRSGLNRHSSL